MTQHAESHCVGKGPCPKCGSRDNLARFSDGHAHCFSMGCDYRERATGEYTPPPSTAKGSRMSDMLEGECEALVARGLTKRTCEHFDYRVGWHGEKKVHIANYRDPVGTNVVAQKVRDREKNFHVRGDLSEAALYGQWLWRDQGKMVVVTEGEIDCLTVSQLQDHKWPVVSVPTGAKGARKSLAAQLSWLLRFDSIILMFDDDEAGRMAVDECAPLFPPGKVKVARIKGYKDANAALMANDAKLVIDAIWGAKEHRPDGIVTVADVREAAIKPLEMGRSWPWPTLTRLTLGRRLGEVYLYGAGTGVGKSEVFDEVIKHVVHDEGNCAAVFKFEQPVGETVKRIAGKIAGRRFHIPGAAWTQEELVMQVDELITNNRLFLYDCFGQCDWSLVANHIRYIHASTGAKDYFIDHLTAMAETGDSERGSLEEIMKEAATLAQELNICLHMISHLTTPEGTPHEEGGRVMIRHFKGSRAIGFWSHFMFGLERNQQHEDERFRSITTFRCLKDRYTGQSVGEVFYLQFNRTTGRLEECELPEDETAFKDESSSSKGDDPPF